MTNTPAPMEAKTIKPVLNRDGSLKNTILKVGGKNYSCTCGCKVFHQPDDTKPDLYECNSCGLHLEADRS